MRSRNKQTQLNFAPLPSSSPSTDRFFGGRGDRLANVRYDSPAEKATSSPRTPAALPTPAHSSQQNAPVVDISDSSDAPAKFHKPTASSLNLYDASTDDGEDDVVLPQSSKRRRITPHVREESSDEFQNDEEVAASTPSKLSVNLDRQKGRSSRRLRSSRAAENQSPSSPTVFAEITSSRRPTTRSQRGTRQSPPAQPRTLPDDSKEEIGSAETTDDDADAIVTKPSIGRRVRKAITSRDDFVVDDDEVEVLSDTKDDDDVVAISSRRGRRSPQASPKTPRRQSRQEKLDLEEDLEDLKDSAVTRARTRGAPVDSKKAERKNYLDILKRRRAGEKVSMSPTPGEDEEGETGRYYQNNYPAIDTSSDELGSASSTEGPPPEDLDTYEADFIESDEDETLGAPSEMPIEYTLHAYKKPREHFKYVVEWIVHNKLNPAFSRNDPIYTLAFSKVDDEVRAQAGSKFISSAWNVDFRRALEARPLMNVEQYDSTVERGCDACNRTNHPATYDVSFGGSAYNHRSLESVEDSDDGDDSEGVDSKSVDSRGREIPPQSRHFHIGRFCKANAVIAHTLCHWRWALNEWILDFLKGQDVTTPQKIVERENWSQKRKTKFANEVVDRMEESGEIKQLWVDFKANQEAARQEKPARWSSQGGSRITQAVKL